MPNTPNDYSRREFLAAASGALPGIGLFAAGRVPMVPPFEQAEQSGQTNPATLPPRVVALRTLGGDFRFEPVGLLVEPGTSVIWLNMGDFHTTTAFHPDNDALLSGGVPLRIPEGAESWHSGLLGLTAGTQFEHRFQVEGVYDYFCQPHYNFGMVGRIIVGRPHGGSAMHRPLSELPEPAQRQMPSVEIITNRAGRTFEWTARLNGLLYLIANEIDPGAAAVRVVQEMREDAALQQLVSEAGIRTEFEAAVTGFIESISANGDYETLVAQADVAKNLLENARKAAE